MTLAACASSLGSVDGHALQIDELKGTKPTEKIDLSDKKLGDTSAIIIASYIKDNGVLKELECAAARVVASVSHSTHARYTCPFHLPSPFARSLHHNYLGPEAGMAIAEALKGNTTLTTLESAALPSNPPARASSSFTAGHASLYFTPFAFP